MGDIQTLTNNGAVTRRQSLKPSDIEAWRPMEPVPETWTVGQLEATVTELTQSLKPCAPEELMAAIFKLTEFGRNYAIQIPNPSGLAESYRDTLCKLPGDVLARAVQETIAGWKWGNRLPMPADILTAGQRHATERMMLLGRAKMALGKMTARRAPVNPISPAATKAQCEALVKKSVKRMEAWPEDQMTPEEAEEDIARRKRLFFENFGL